MKKLRCAAIVAGALSFAVIGAAAAQEKIRVGIIAHLSGPFAASGQQFREGIDTFLSVHGNQAGGREVEVLYRDIGGASPAAAKRLAQELVVQDKAAVLGGMFLSPDASAIASVINETKTPAVVFVSASPPIVRQSPYFVRVGSSIWQTSWAPAEWAYKQGKRRAYIAVSDYAPGYDVQAAFERRFKEMGGEIVGADRMPLNTVDYAPFVERILKAKPDVVHTFIPSGAPLVAFLRAMAAAGVFKDKDAPMILGGAFEIEPDLPAIGDIAVGIYSTMYYATALTTDANKAFLKALSAKLGDKAVPLFTQVTAFDGMRLIYRMIEAQQGKPFDGDAALAAVKGFAWESPRGPVRIDPQTRNIIQNIYIRRLDRVDGKLVNNIIFTIPTVNDPWAALNPN